MPNSKQNSHSLVQIKSFIFLSIISKFTVRRNIDWKKGKSIVWINQAIKFVEVRKLIILNNIRAIKFWIYQQLLGEYNFEFLGKTIEVRFTYYVYTTYLYNSDEPKLKYIERIMILKISKSVFENYPKIRQFNDFLPSQKDVEIIYIWKYLARI